MKKDNIQIDHNEPDNVATICISGSCFNTQDWQHVIESLRELPHSAVVIIKVKYHDTYRAVQLSIPSDFYDELVFEPNLEVA